MTEKRQSAAPQQEPGPKPMAIGEFDGAATLSGEGSPFMTTPMYWLYEMGHAALDLARLRRRHQAVLQEPGQSALAHHLRQARSPRRWNCSSAPRASMAVRTGASTRLLSAASACRCGSLPSGSGRSAVCCISSVPSNIFRGGRSRRSFMVAPMSGHYATLLRGTVGSLPAQPRRLHHRLARTRARCRWRKAASISTIISTTSFPCCTCLERRRACGRGSVSRRCRCLPPSRLMEADDDPYVPHTMTLMGGPIDTRVNATAVNKLAMSKRHRLVSQPRHHQGAVSASRRDARCLSGLFAALRLRRA